MMQFLVLIAAAASLAAASGSAGSLRDRRALRARDGAKRGAAADAVAGAVRGVKTEKMCGVDVPIYGDLDFLDSELSREKLEKFETPLLGEGGFGWVYQVTMKRGAFQGSSSIKESIKGTTVALKIPFGQRINGNQREMEKESVLGLLVCRHGDPASCPAGSPFVSFIGDYISTKQDNDPSFSIGNCWKEYGGCPIYELATGVGVNALLDPKKPDEAAKKNVKRTWNAFVAAHSVTSNAASKPLKNLDAVLVIVRQLTSAVVRLQELGITHHDIKPANIVLAGAAGIKLVDFGLACVDGKIAEACSKLACKLDIIDGQHGTQGYISGPKIYKTLCGEKDVCSATELRTVDLFSVGVTLLELLTGAYKSLDILPDENAACHPQNKDFYLNAMKKINVHPHFFALRQFGNGRTLF